MSTFGLMLCWECTYEIKKEQRGMHWRWLDQTCVLGQERGEVVGQHCQKSWEMICLNEMGDEWELYEKSIPCCSLVPGQHTLLGKDLRTRSIYKVKQYPLSCRELKTTWHEMGWCHSCCQHVWDDMKCCCRQTRADAHHVSMAWFLEHV